MSLFHALKRVNNQQPPVLLAFGLVLLVSSGVALQLQNGIHAGQGHGDGGRRNTLYFVGQPTTGVAVHPSLSGVSESGNGSHIMEVDHHDHDHSKTSEKITDILHGLFSKYDNRIRPFFPRSAVLVTVSLPEFSIIGVGEGRGEICSTLTLEQNWIDPRLIFEEGGNWKDDGGPPVEDITMSHEHIRDLWLPDTYVVNEKIAQVHEGSAVNDAVVVFKNGTLIRSTRITVTTHCEFRYGEFPFDRQECQLVLGSHAYRIEDMALVWNEAMLANSVMHSANVGSGSMYGFSSGRFRLTQFALNETVEGFNFGRMSRLTIHLTLQRAWRPFVTRFYLPMILFVFVSLGSLFLRNVRVALILNLLNLTFVNIFLAVQYASKDFPETGSGRTALDTYVLICFVYIGFIVLVKVRQLLKMAPTSGDHQRVISAGLPAGEQSHQSDRMDIFNPVNHRRQRNRHQPENHSGCEILEEGDEEEDDVVGRGERTAIYNSPSYPLRLSSRWVWGRRGFRWLLSQERWILILSFLLTDYIYFKMHSVP